MDFEIRLDGDDEDCFYIPSLDTNLPAAAPLGTCVQRVTGKWATGASISWPWADLERDPSLGLSLHSLSQFKIGLGLDLRIQLWRDYPR